MKTLIIGITGHFCSGKSIVAKIFATSGAKVIDVDSLAKENLNNNAVKNKLRKAFGSNIFLKNGKISKVKLAKVAFSDRKNLKKLNKATHPILHKELEKLLKKLFLKTSIIVLDMATLLGSSFYKKCDYTIGVLAPCNLKIKRAGKRGFTKSDFLRRVKLQPSQKEIKHRCDYVIVNKQTLMNLKTKVKQILEDIENEERRKR